MAEMPTLLTVKEAADVLRVSRTTLYGHLTTGALPSCTIGARRLIRAADLAAYIDSNMTGADRAAAV